jgi:hypothetical protein
MLRMSFLTMGGTLRGHMEGNAPARMTKKLREQLASLILANCRAV